MDFVFYLEVIGTIAFAISGALVAIEKKMDVFGVAILGMTTAVGGGIVRDIILGNFPPAAFQNPFNALLAIVVSLIIFFPFVRHSLGFKKTRKGILLMDAVGLAVFTMLGLRAGFRYDNFFLAVFVGVVDVHPGQLLHRLVIRSRERRRAARELGAGRVVLRRASAADGAADRRSEPRGEGHEQDDGVRAGEGVVGQ